jgi:ankyrin repeat protein
MTSDVQAAWDAIQFDNLEVLKTLVPSSVSPSASTRSPTHPVQLLIHCAALHGAIDCATYLIKNRANVEAKNFSGFTALHWTAYSGRYETIDLLLANGADIEARTDDGRTALHIAASRGHLQYLLELLKAKPDLEAISSQGWTALHFAIVSNQRKTAEKLIELGVREDGPDAQGKTLSDLAAEYERKWFAELLTPE